MANEFVKSESPAHLPLNSGILDEYIHSDSLTFKDRLGRERLTVKGMEQATGDASLAVQAATSARDSELAALASQQASAASAANAGAFKAQAESARDAAALAALTAPGIYATEAEGRAAVNDGETFTVQGEGSVAIEVFKRISATVSEHLFDMPGVEAVSKLAVDIQIQRTGTAAAVVLPEHHDLRGGSLVEFADGKSDAVIEFAGSRVIKVVDTTRDVETNQMQINASGGISFDGDVVVESIDGDKHLSLSAGANLVISGAHGKILSFSGDGSIEVGDLQDLATANEGELVELPSGALGIAGRSSAGGEPAKPLWRDGRIHTTAMPMPAPSRDALPVISFIGSSDARPAAENFGGIASVEYVEGRMWFAYCGSNTGEEGAGNYLVVGFNDNEAANYPIANSVRYFYIDHQDSDGRIADCRFTYFPDEKVLRLYFSSVVGENDGQWGGWEIAIAEPGSARPIVSRPALLSTVGISTRPWLCDGRWLIGYNLRSSPTLRNDLNPWKGQNLYALQRAERYLGYVGKVPEIAGEILSYQETSYVQLPSGELIAVYRTTEGLHIVRSESGDPENWGTPERFALLDPQPTTRTGRCAMRVTKNGNVIIVWNRNGTNQRRNMTVGISTDGLRTFAVTPLEFEGAAGASCSYPDITFGDGDTFYIGYDYNRSSPWAIKCIRFSESGLLAGTDTGLKTYLISDITAGA